MWAGAPPSQQVSWWETHEFYQAALAQANVGPLPWPGTPAWCELAAGDPRKMLALASFGVHHALRVETAQEVECAASRAISAAQDWGAVARSMMRHAGAVRSGAYTPRRTA
ncbi:DUF2742 domain-containing protein [Mycobacterium sp.]|uniref:DUF2742 domain-containing protein n=1 Tax=Mycobacterium sp. TaxID=1785 RepID=UPI000CC3DC14|nr:DUF2742 domain-containing protein [Mycobacterium sp.]PJE07944.1 MAG: hypothetical protein CK428_21620 [Mycobacterium sp.]